MDSFSSCPNQACLVEIHQMDHHKVNSQCQIPGRMGSCTTHLQVSHAIRNTEGRVHLKDSEEL